MTRDVDLAEDLAQDALLAALEQWPTTGVPDKPGAWLMTTAKRRGIDHIRRADVLRRKTAELEHLQGLEGDRMPDLDSKVDAIEDAQLTEPLGQPGQSKDGWPRWLDGLGSRT